VPPLKRSFNFFLKGELVVEVSPPPELGSWMCLKLSRIGFTADIASAAGFILTLISEPLTESKGGFDSVASCCFSFSLLLTLITVYLAIACSSNWYGSRIVRTESGCISLPQNRHSPRAT
jgi:hypothetical protein